MIEIKFAPENPPTLAQVKEAYKKLILSQTKKKKDAAKILGIDRRGFYPRKGKS